jgi:hypothetical protein
MEYIKACFAPPKPFYQVRHDSRELLGAVPVNQAGMIAKL